MGNEMVAKKDLDLGLLKERLKMQSEFGEIIPDELKYFSVLYISAENKPVSKFCFNRKEAEDFLESENFPVVKRSFCKNKFYLKRAISKVGFPCVMKVYSKEIVHKNKFKGVHKNINNYSSALEIFNSLKKLPGFRGVVIQKEISGREIILGIKRTLEFGHIILFGSGGIEVEEKRDVSFRITPFNKIEALKLIQETRLFKVLNSREKNHLVDLIMDLQELASDYPRIKELDINPLMIKDNFFKIVDSRIVFE